MPENEFQKGFLSFDTRIIRPLELGKELDAGSWDDGYVAFSNKEYRRSTLGGKSLVSLAEDRVSGIPGAEGYLMEVGFWRSEASAVEEVCAEREDDVFILQRWVLKMQAELKECNCFWRNTETLNRPNSLFSKNELSSIEVILPDWRLHFFITTGGRR